MHEKSRKVPKQCAKIVPKRCPINILQMWRPLSGESPQYLTNLAPPRVSTIINLPNLVPPRASAHITSKIGLPVKFKPKHHSKTQLKHIFKSTLKRPLQFQLQNMRRFFKITIKCPSQSQSAQNKLKVPIYKISKCPYQILEHPYQNQSFQNNFKGPLLDLKVQRSDQSAHINFKDYPLINIQSQGETPPNLKFQTQNPRRTPHQL